MDTRLEKKRGLKKKHIPYIVLGVFVIVALCWLIFGNHSSKLNVDKNKVTIQTVSKGEFNDYTRINGQVQPINTIQLSAIEGGMVAEKLVEEGSMVHQGQVVVRLTNPMLNLSILDSEAQLAEKQNFLRNTQVSMEQEKLNLKKEKLQLDMDVQRKKRKYEQYKKLYSENLTSKEEYLQAKEDYEFAVNGTNLVMERQKQGSIYRGIQIAQMEESLHNIRQNPKMVAINSAIEVDATGQVCADSIGTKIYSGVGGQMDFIRGASLSKGGKAIIALPSTTNKGESKIVSFLKPGAGVVTTRAHVHYVVTEYGVADLYGKTIEQRAKALAEIAHPNFREQILKDYFDNKIS